MRRATETMTHQQAVSTMAVERYLLEEMPEIERHAFEEHFFECADCAEDLRAAEMMRAAAAGAARPAQPLPFAPRPQRRWVTTVLPWAAAASLALVAGYQFVSPPGFDRPYALEPVTLRAANRGAAAVVRLAPGEPAVALAIEADPPPGASAWLYELLDADGRRVVEGRASLQSPGTPLLLLVPASTLHSPGRYTLSLRDRETAPPLEEFRFTVAAP